MAHTVYRTHADHHEVIADYSGSPRHAALPEAEWQNEYSTGQAYQAMRDSHPGFVAGLTPRGTGKWALDWGSPFSG